MKRTLTAVILGLCFTFCSNPKNTKTTENIVAETPVSKSDIQSKLVLKPTLLTYQKDLGERHVKLTIENNNNANIEWLVVNTMLYNAEKKAIFYSEGDTIDAFGFQPRHRRDFIPKHYKGSKTIPLDGVEELGTLKSADSVVLEISEIKLKEF